MQVEKYAYRYWEHGVVNLVKNVRSITISKLTLERAIKSRIPISPRIHPISHEPGSRTSSSPTQVLRAV